MFVFSAENFNQMYRRLRFTREYATYQKAQGEAVKSKQEQVEQKKQELAASKQQKSSLLARGEKEQQLLEGKQSEQQAQVNQLKKQQKTVEALILEQQRREEELNARIDKLIAEELARERARQEAEARRKAEAERKRAAAEEARRREIAQTETKSKTKSKGTGNKQNHHVAETKPTSREVFRTPAEDIKLSGNFEANRGRLPLPITGAYQLVRGFGPYSPEGLSRVRLQSNGWYLKGQGGAKAQCIFDGEVSGVYYQYGSYIVTVRHGKYISAYINLHSVNVKKGQRVKAHDVLGGLGGDNIMQFQLRNWSTLLNPSQWLRR
jgi:septal ring factor EnvC (AmiA/AmiB activator)